MRVYDWDPSNPSNKLWEVTVSVYKHPMTDDATPLCSLTTLMYPQQEVAPQNASSVKVRLTIANKSTSMTYESLFDARNL